MRVESSEGTTQPLRVGGIATLKQKAESDQVAHEPCGDDTGAEIVPDLGRASNKRLLLRYALPLTSEQPQPDLVGVPGERDAHAGKLADRIVEHGSGRCLEELLLRRDQPVADIDAAAGFEAELLFQSLIQRQDVDVVLYRGVIPAEPGGPSVEFGWQP